MADAAGGIETLRRSIVELCTADHHGDALEIEDWLRNKTASTWAQWIARADAVVLVADRENRIVSVGMADLRGDILLNYVHPDARFSGVSKAMLSAIEAQLRACGVRNCRLESTLTARSFYERCGFRPMADNALILAKSL